MEEEISGSCPFRYHVPWTWIPAVLMSMSSFVTFGIAFFTLFEPSNNKSPAISMDIQPTFTVDRRQHGSSPDAVAVLLKANVRPEEVLTEPVILRYLAEGAANAIWTIEYVEEGHTTNFYQNKLLRLRKGTKSQSYSESRSSPPPYLSSEAVFEHWNEFIKPEFDDYPNDLVDQQLVTLSSEVVSECNKVLDNLEGTGARPGKRHGWHIEHTETTGLVITSMVPTEDSSVLVHMKPKWLAQSPGAPADAVRCRTCALQAFRATPKHLLPVCPLALVSRKQFHVQRVISELPDSAMSLLPPNINRGELETKLTDFFLNTNLLLHIRNLQQKYDPKGTQHISETNREKKTSRSEIAHAISNLGLAMTFRDCSLFMKLRKVEREIIIIEARLADLDPKLDWRDPDSPENEIKLTKWARDESFLVKEGWYMGTETLGEGMKRHESCLLWKGYDATC